MVMVESGKKLINSIFWGNYSVIFAYLGPFSQLPQATYVCWIFCCLFPMGTATFGNPI